MEDFLVSIYHKGFENGAKASHNTDFKIKLVEVLKKSKGVGPKTFDNIMRTVKELGI